MLQTKTKKTFRVRKKGNFRVHNSMLSLGSQSLFPSTIKQKLRLIERKKAEIKYVQIKGLKFSIERGVYKTGIDTELMIDALKKERKKTFLEIGCGCGAISLSLAKRNISGVAVDINELAVINTYENCKLNDVNNLSIIKGDVFENVTGKFDIVVCNPPYNLHEVEDDIDRMFWDPNNSMKINFFNQVLNYLEEGGKVYFGWADFSDLELNFPIRMAKLNGLNLINTYSRPSTCSSFRFLVFEFSSNSRQIQNSNH